MTDQELINLLRRDGFKVSDDMVVDDSVVVGWVPKEGFVAYHDGFGEEVHVAFTDYDKFKKFLRGDEDYVRKVISERSW